MITRERRILAATAVLAVGVPLGAASWVRSRTDDLAGHLTAASGVPAEIGAVDADLTGAIRLTDLALGSLVSVDAIEASVAMSSLLGGNLRADEIRVDGPRVALAIDAGGDSDLARLARRLATRGAARHGGKSGIRRIIVAEGALTARIAGLGELAAENVELVPDAAGVRVITGPVRVRGNRGGLDVALGFSRAAAELHLPSMHFGRVLAVGGTGRVTIDHDGLALRDVSAGRLADHGDLELRGAIDDAGVARSVAVAVAPSDLAITLAGERVPLAALAALVPHSVDLSRAHASGTLTMRRSPARLELAVDGKLEDVVVEHRTVSEVPLPITAALRGDITITPEAVAVPRATLAMGDLQLTASGWVRRSGPVSGQLDATLASAPCASLLGSLPPALRGPLDGMILDGELGARARLTVDLAAPEGEGTALATSFTGACTVAAEPPEADVTMLARTSEQQLADGTRARIGKTEASFAKLAALPFYVPGAFVSAEDGRFWNHDGFDQEQIARSLEIDLRERRLARGGSTISQQLVKNAFLSQRRSVDRKIQEAVLTWRLEDRLDKKQILERYLNIIELGPRVFGLRAGAKYWFNLSPRELAPHQAAFLAAITSQPSSMSRRIRRTGGLDPDSAERVAVVLRAMRRDGVLTPEQFETASHAPMYFTTTAVPRER